MPKTKLLVQQNTSKTPKTIGNCLLYVCQMASDSVIKPSHAMLTKAKQPFQSTVIAVPLHHNWLKHIYTVSLPTS